MSFNVTLCFAAGTGIELYLLSLLSQVIGIVNTISLCMFTFLLGWVAGRSWGKEYFEKLQWNLKSQTLPGDETLNGVVMAIASVLLITPGIITDVLGVLILFPVSRGVFKEITLSLVKKKISRGEVYFFFKD
ncbi:MAG: FxsA family protein [Nitrospinales bacterium]